MNVPTEAMHVVDKVACRISSVEALSADILGIKLALADEGFLHRSGQYLDLVLPDGSKRSFSIVNRPDREGTVELHVRQPPGGGFIREVLDTRQRGGELAIEGPFGEFHFRDRPQDRHVPVIFLASGTGFSPFKAMIEDLVAARNRRPVHLYWGGRIKDDFYLHDWVTRQAEAMPALAYVPVLSEAKAGDAWTGRTGFVHHAVIVDFPDLRDFHVYTCGAPVVVESARRDFVTRCGLPEDSFFN
ncbi:hypothetical protein D3870_11305 [Noviherbaspirillum cavernae]|uniref:FAD-binding FR-type domain-containing protein n=1 Tax=Noviherbaspirillum cavernae TaxID=2320862 RepID=A0A418X253_9BURK|nr:FAD-binding oxidoreductase [Noviherbaspirillum cavernae]RJG06520.1 hypothetical protein D3870_11305 [Noviherbaspirillum cavernae]